MHEETGFVGRLCAEWHILRTKEVCVAHRSDRAGKNTDKSINEHSLNSIDGIVCYLQVNNEVGPAVVSGEDNA